MNIKCNRLYSGKFLQDSIFADGQSLPFHGFNFRRRAHSRPLCTVQLSLFHGFNFAVRRSSAKTMKIGSLENFLLYSMCTINGNAVQGSLFSNYLSEKLSHKIFGHKIFANYGTYTHPYP